MMHLLASYQKWTNTIWAAKVDKFLSCYWCIMRVTVKELGGQGSTFADVDAVVVRIKAVVGMVRGEGVKRVVGQVLGYSGWAGWCWIWHVAI